MKRFKLCILMLMTFFVPSIIFASDNTIPEITTEEELISCLETGGYCKLGVSLKLDSELKVDKEVVLDLNGQSLTPADGLKKQGGLLLVERGAKLTIRDSKGTGKISAGAKDDPSVWAAIQLVYDNQDADELAELIVESGTIEGYYYGIVGNGNNHYTKVTINGGTIIAMNDEDSTGIYHPQIGILTVNGGTIQGGSGIEIRSGTLEINNGTIKGVAPSLTTVANGNGTTTNGVGVAVAQHKTKNAINVTINGGNISGQYAFYEWNPQLNSSDDLKKVSIKINGGTFTGTGDGTVYSQDFTNFISGGSFNKPVTKYLTANAKVTSKTVDKTENLVVGEKSSKGGIIALVISLIVIGIVAGYVYFKKYR